jgi:hypothetical protein
MVMAPVARAPTASKMKTALATDASESRVLDFIPRMAIFQHIVARDWPSVKGS